jgi:hypothetical protein
VKTKCVYVLYSSRVVLGVVLAVMCISAIYYLLSLGLRSAARSGQAKLKIAKPSHQRRKQSKRLGSLGGQNISVTLREEQG